MAAPLRIAVALSGGVDSSVAALLLRRCVKTERDVRALTSPRSTAPPLKTVMAALEKERPLSTWSPDVVTDQAESRPVQLVPLYMKNWDDVEAANGWCVRAMRDYDDATAVARSLSLVPSTGSLAVVRLAAEYVEHCFEPMLDAYAEGRTLNVDVLCNEHIKFGHLWQHLQQQRSDETALRADLLATGHYARVWAPHLGPAFPARAALVQRPFSASADLNDQTIFLSRVRPDVVRCALFPLGHLFASKADVREAARCWWGRAGVAEAEAEVHNRSGPTTDLHALAEKKTSTGICFVGAPPKPSKPSPASSSTFAFAQFLHDYVRPSHTTTTTTVDAAALPCTSTVFRDADTGDVLDPDGFAWSRSSDLWREYSGCQLPAFSFTLGQKLLYTAPSPAADGTRSRHLHKPYYVWKKELAPVSARTVTPCAARLQAVWLVPQWDDARLLSRRVHLTAVCCHVSLSFISPPSASSAAADDAGAVHAEVVSGEVTVRGWCCTRHQEKLRRATLRVRPAHGSDRPPEYMVDLEEPVRALTPGQALVIYVAPHQLEPTGHAYSADDNERDLVVVASGWVVGSESSA